VAPGPTEALDGGARIPAEDLRDEHGGLVDLIANDGVAGAPVELERHAGECELPREGVGAPARVGERPRQRRAADLLAREPLQAAAAGQLRKVPVPARHVGRRVERGRAREQMRMTRSKEEHLLPAHRPTDRVHALQLDVDAVPLSDPRHAREVGDLAGVPPRVGTEATALAGGIDHGEAADRGQVAEEAGVLPRRQAAPVRRDDERDPAAVVAAREQEVCGADAAVVRAVVDQPHFDLGPHGGSRGGRQEQEQGERRRGGPHESEAKARIAKMPL